MGDIFILFIISTNINWCSIMRSEFFWHRFGCFFLLFLLLFNISFILEFCSYIFQILITCVFDLNERSEEHTSELKSRGQLVCRLLLEKKKAMVDSG